MASELEVAAPGELLFSTQRLTYAFENVAIRATAGLLPAGRMLGAQTVASTSAAKAGGNTGNGTMGAITTAPNTRPGVYALRITVAALNAGTFTVTDPTGVVIGTGTVAVAFSAGGLAFTLADGTIDFIVGDGFDLTVPTTLYENYDDGLSNGTQQARGILYAEVDATTAQVPATLIVRDAEVVAARVTSKNAGDKAAGITDLAAQGIVFR